MTTETTTLPDGLFNSSLRGQCVPLVGEQPPLDRAQGKPTPAVHPQRCSRRFHRMSLLSLCPGGGILEPPIAHTESFDFTGFADELIRGLTPPQRKVFDSPARFKMLCSGRRFGKTHLCLVQLISWAAKKKGSLNWYVAPTYKAAKQIARTPRQWCRSSYLPQRMRLISASS